MTAGNSGDDGIITQALKNKFGPSKCTVVNRSLFAVFGRAENESTVNFQDRLRHLFKRGYPDSDMNELEPPLLN